MLPNLLIHPFSSASTLIPSPFANPAKNAKSKLCRFLDSIPCSYQSSCNGMLVSWVKDADGFNLNLISFLYVVVSSSPKKATIVSFRLGQQLICHILHSFNWPPPSSGCMWPTFLSSRFTSSVHRRRCQSSPKQAKS